MWLPWRAERSAADSVVVVAFAVHYSPASFWSTRGSISGTEALAAGLFRVDFARIFLGTRVFRKLSTPCVQLGCEKGGEESVRTGDRTAQNVFPSGPAHCLQIERSTRSIASLTFLQYPLIWHVYVERSVQASCQARCRYQCIRVNAHYGQFARTVQRSTTRGLRRLVMRRMLS